MGFRVQPTAYNPPHSITVSGQSNQTHLKLHAFHFKSNRVGRPTENEMQAAK